MFNFFGSIHTQLTAHNASSSKPPILALVAALTLVAGCDDGGGSSGVANGGQIALDDAKVYSMIEERRYEVLPGVGNTSDVNVESWRWNDTPFRFGPLVECSGLEGFDSSLAARNLGEACSITDRCNFSFDQADRDNEDGTRSSSFVVEVPVLKAPIGLSYRLRGLTDRGETVNSSATFCLVPVNEAPSAENDSFTVVQGDILRIDAASAINLLSNDVDDDDRSNTALTVATTPLVAPQFATQFTLGADGGFSYRFDGDLSVQGGNTVVDTFQYQISDGIHTSSAEVRITVVSRNDPPVVNGTIPGHTAVIGIPTEFDFSSAFSDPEGSQLQYSLVPGSLPANSDLRASVLGVLTGTAGPNDAGNYTVTAVASDGVSSASSNFLLTIADNQSPVITALADQSIAFGTLFNLDVSQSFRDPEGAPLTYSLVSEPASDLVINPQSGLISGNLPEAGTFEITVSASDGFNGPVSSTFLITQGARPNRAPLFSGVIDNQGILLGQTPTAVTGGFTDLDDDALTYSISSIPPGMTFSETAGTLAGTPTQLGIFTLTISATDTAGASADSNAFTITVTEVPNEAPTFGSPIQDLTATEGVAITPFTAAFTDPEGRALTYTSTLLPAGLSLNAETGEVSGTPTSSGIVDVTITAQDDAGDTSTSNSFTISVEPPANVPPAFTGSIADVIVTVGTAISSISGNFTDTDPLTYSSTTLPAGIALNTTTGVLTGTPTEVGTTSVSLTATDPDAGSVTSNTFVIMVSDVPNNPPTNSNAIPAQSAVVGTAVSAFNIAGFFNDIDTDDTLTFNVSSANALPTGLSLSAAGVITGTPTAIGSFTVVVTATDDDNAAASSSPFIYTVTSANADPVISGRTPTGTINLVVGGGDTVEFTVSDESVATLEYTVSSSSTAVSVVAVADGEYEISGISAGTSILTFTVTDELGLTDTETVTVIVATPTDNPPQINSVTPSAASVTVNPGTPLSVAVAATDETVSTLVYTASSSNTAVATVTAGTGGNYTVTANPVSSTSPGGTTTIVLTVTDASDQADTYTFTVNVPAPAQNLPPEITGRSPPADPILSILVGDTDPVTISVTDEDEASLVYTSISSPAGIVSITSTGDGSYQISGVAAGTTTVTLSVTDDLDQTDTEIFDVQVPDPDPQLAPVFTGAIGDESFPEGVAIDPLDVSVFFTDPNSDVMTFTDSGLPAGLSMSSVGIISGTPEATGVASITSVIISAIDLTGSNTATDADAFDIAITVANQAPQFTGPISDEVFVAGTPIPPIDMSLFFTDPEGDAITLSDSGFPTGLSMDLNGIVTGTPTLVDPLEPETTVVSITAIDSLGSATATVSDPFEVAVISP